MGLDTKSTTTPSTFGNHLTMSSGLTSNRFLGHGMTTMGGQSVDQLYTSLANERVAKEQNRLNLYDDALVKEFMERGGYDVRDFERDMRNLKTDARVAYSQQQGTQAPGKRFGGLGSRKILND